jgi:hypothetical protein
LLERRHLVMAAAATSRKRAGPIVERKGLKIALAYAPSARHAADRTRPASSLRANTYYDYASTGHTPPKIVGAAIEDLQAMV